MPLPVVILQSTSTLVYLKQYKSGTTTVKPLLTGYHWGKWEAAV